MDVDKESPTKVVDLDDKRLKEQRLKRLQNLIDQGEYSISASQIADALFNKEPLGADPIDFPAIEKNSKKD